MRGWGTVVVAVAVSGCSSLTYLAFPETKVIRHTETTRVEIDSEPAGATIVRDGKVIGTAPLVVDVPYTVTKRYTLHTRKRGAIGCIGDAAIAAAAIYGVYYYEQTRDRDFNVFAEEPGTFATPAPYLIALAAAALVNCGATTSKGMPSPYYRNPVATERSEPARLAIEARWDGWPSTTASVMAPGTSSLLVRRPDLGFDGVLLAWAASGKTPSAEGLYRLGLAETRFLEATRDRKHAQRAIEWFEKYLATDGVGDDRKTEVERRIAVLR